jgi:hypothetical protein
MAFLIPEHVRSDQRVPSDHRRVAKAFAMGLDDATTVWYEPPFDIDGVRPHFVVLDPALGVFVVMVFGEHGDELLGALRGALRVERDGAELELPNPLELASAFGREIQSRVDRNPRVPAVPVEGIAVFARVDAPRAEQLGVEVIVATDHAIFKDDLDAAISSGDEAILTRIFNKLVEGGLPDDLTNAEQDEVRALIHPEVVIRPAEGQGSLFGRSTEPDQVVKVMDLRQERLAKGLGGGHRVIRGVAGSGKTIVLIARARLLARSYPQDRILVTCFTRSLASRLREHLRDQPNIEVIHLHKLIQRVIRLTGLDRKGPPDFDAWPALALEALAVGDVDVDRYRAVLVDEAQDFATDSLRFCVEMLERRPADEQDLLIAADSAQNIFRRNFRWKDAGIQAQGRTRILRVNYRNTKEILRFAHEFLMADPTLRLDDAPDAEDELSIVPAESAERTGAEPTVTLVDDDETEVAGVVETVMGWYTNRAPARSIAVLTIRKDGVPRRGSRRSRRATFRSSGSTTRRPATTRTGQEPPTTPSSSRRSTRQRGSSSPVWWCVASARAARSRSMIARRSTSVSPAPPKSWPSSRRKVTASHTTSSLRSRSPERASPGRSRGCPRRGGRVVGHATS